VKTWSELEVKAWLIRWLGLDYILYSVPAVFLIASWHIVRWNRL